MSRARLALFVALAADALQIIFLPAFVGGVLEPWDGLVDLAVGAVMIALLGWHVAFLPSFLVKLLPVVDIFPTWTTSVLFVTRGRLSDPAP